MNRKHIILYMIGGLLPLAPCAPGCRDKPDDPPKAGAPACEVLQDEFSTVNASAKVDLDSAIATFGGEGSYASLEKRQAGLDSLQKDFNLAASQLCQDRAAGSIDDAQYQARRHCVERRLAYLRAIQQVSKLAVDLKESKNAAFNLDSKLDGLLSTLDCEERATKLAREVPGDGKGVSFGGSVVSTSGTVLDTGMQFQVSPKEGFVSKELDLTATLICERRDGSGQYTSVPDCEGKSLTEGDRFRVAFRSSQSGHFYVMLFNGTNQFQVFSPHNLFPDNRVTAFQPAVFPPDRWIDLDEVQNVIERVVVVVSTHPIAQLEAIKGADVPPSAEGQLAEEVSKVRGMLEGVVATSGAYKDINAATDLDTSILSATAKGRGRLQPSVTRGGSFGAATGAQAESWEVDGKQTESVPTVVKTRDVAGVQFMFEHK